MSDPSVTVDVLHPGKILFEQAMKPLGVSRNKLARDIDVPVGRISDIVAGKRTITPDTALRLAKYLGTEAELWLKLQAEYDLAVARATVWAEIEPRVRILVSEEVGDELDLDDELDEQEMPHFAAAETDDQQDAPVAAEAEQDDAVDEPAADPVEQVDDEPEPEEVVAAAEEIVADDEPSTEEREPEEPLFEAEAKSESGPEPEPEPIEQIVEQTLSVRVRPVSQEPEPAPAPDPVAEPQGEGEVEAPELAGPDIAAEVAKIDLPPHFTSAVDPGALPEVPEAPAASSSSGFSPKNWAARLFPRKENEGASDGNVAEEAAAAESGAAEPEGAEWADSDPETAPLSLEIPDPDEWEDRYGLTKRASNE